MNCLLPHEASTIVTVGGGRVGDLLAFASWRRCGEFCHQEPSPGADARRGLSQCNGFEKPVMARMWRPGSLVG